MKNLEGRNVLICADDTWQLVHVCAVHVIGRSAFLEIAPLDQDHQRRTPVFVHADEVRAIIPSADLRDAPRLSPR